jgi:hypothetical protein
LVYVPMTFYGTVLFSQDCNLRENEASTKLH